MRTFVFITLSMFFVSCSKAEPAPPAKNNGFNNGLTNNATNNTNNSNNANNQNNVNNANNLECVDLDPTLGPCDPLCQTGCEPGEHCVTTQPTANDPVETFCEPQQGGGQGAMCNSTDDCGVGFSCRNFLGDQACRQYCRPGGAGVPQCPGGHACIPITDPRVGICVEINHQCDPVPVDTCAGAGEDCYDFPSGRRCELAGTSMLDEDCAASVDCVEGLRCVGDGDRTACRAICNPQDPMCPNDLNCAEIRNQNGETLPWGACF